MHLTHLGPEGLDPYTLVIVGTSFAALPIAESLATSARVLLVESGDVAERDESTALTMMEESGHLADGHWRSHWIRAAGGTSTRWSGVVAALEPEDFEGGPGRPAWPVRRADLEDPYQRAAAWLGRPGAVCAPGVAFGDRLIACPLSHDVPMRLPDRVRERTRGPGLDLLTRHTVVRLVSRDRARVDGLVVTGPDRVTATWPVGVRQRVILAAGAMGNAQILLQPPGIGETPVGNESGLVGRFLMEHPHVVSGHALVHRAGLPSLPEGFGPGLTAFRLPPRVMAQHDLLPCSLAVQGPIAPPDSGAAVHAHFERAFARPLEWAQLYARAEQEPSADNRVLIGPDRTWAGSFQLRAHCVFSSRDLRSIDVSTRLLGEALVTGRLGAVQVLNRAIYRDTAGGGHTMGTTRMGPPGDAVCDASLRVHGYANLYVSGSSVFPTGGAANPTLTIVALAMRLADHLRPRLGTAP